MSYSRWYGSQLCWLHFLGDNVLDKYVMGQYANIYTDPIQCIWDQKRRKYCCQKSSQRNSTPSCLYTYIGCLKEKQRGLGQENKRDLHQASTSISNPGAGHLLSDMKGFTMCKHRFYLTQKGRYPNFHILYSSLSSLTTAGSGAKGGTTWKVIKF